MKTIKYFIVILLTIGFIQNLHAEGIDVSITLRDAHSGGSINLNSATKPKNEGKWTKGPLTTPEFIVIDSYHLSRINISNYILSVDLTMKKAGEKNRLYAKKIKISENGELSFTPFNGIMMNIYVSGFTNQVESSK